MDHPAGESVRLQWMLVADLMSLLFLVSLGFVGPRAIAQEVVGQAPQRMAMDPTVLTVEHEKAQASKPGSDFKECVYGCPEMIVIPAGKFIMGSPENELDRNASEGPPHEVTIAKPFALSKFEVTFEEWDACVAAAACPRVPDRWGREKMPVINVSWVDAKQYVSWLSQLTGKEYRLPTEAEWEYAARAGVNTRYSWGDDLGMGNANCDGCGSPWDLQQTAPVGSFKPNRAGLYDMHGNGVSLLRGVLILLPLHTSPTSSALRVLKKRARPSLQSISQMPGRAFHRDRPHPPS